MEPTLGNLILTARERSGLTQQALADLVPTDRETISDWELGHQMPRTVRHLRALEMALGIQLTNRISKATLGARIREARLARGESQAQFGAFLGVTEKTVNQWEAGAHAPRHLGGLQAKLGVQLTDTPRAVLEPTELASLSGAELIALHQRVSAEMARRIPRGVPDEVALFEAESDNETDGEVDGQVPITLSRVLAEGLSATRASDVRHPWVPPSAHTAS